jgi:hypothetical protein
MPVFVKASCTNASQCGHYPRNFQRGRSSRVNIKLFVNYFWLILLFASVGVCVASLQIINTPRQYVSLAKLAVKTKLITNPNTSIIFCNMINETLESSEMCRRNSNRVLVLHPELKACNVVVDSSQTNEIFDNCVIFSVRTFGKEPEYIKTYLDALLDEFEVFIEERHVGDTMIIERATDPIEKAQDWILPVCLGGGGGTCVGAFLSFFFARVSPRFSSNNNKPQNKRPGQ